jgi:hypothetical protein
MSFPSLRSFPGAPVAATVEQSVLLVQLQILRQLKAQRELLGSRTRARKAVHADAKMSQSRAID